MKRKPRPARQFVPGPPLLPVPPQRPLLRTNFLRRILERIDVHHPAEDNGVERPFGLSAPCLRRDRTLQPKLGPVGVAALIFWREAEIGVEVPLRDAQWNTLVQLFFRYTFGHRVHRAD